jgi:hypothetical protein
MGTDSKGTNYTNIYPQNRAVNVYGRVKTTGIMER